MQMAHAKRMSFLQTQHATIVIQRQWRNYQSDMATRRKEQALKVITR
jgi:hypothetical protein